MFQEQQKDDSETTLAIYTTKASFPVATAVITGFTRASLVLRLILLAAYIVDERWQIRHYGFGDLIFQLISKR